MEPTEHDDITAKLAGMPKFRGLESKVDSVDEAARTVVSVINTDGLDRYQTVIEPKGIDLDAYRRNPVVLWNHCCKTPPIGRNLWIKRRTNKATGRGELLAKTIFDDDEFSELLFRKCVAGTLGAWSIRFEPDYRHSSPPTAEEIKARPELKECYAIYRKSTLMEYSLVIVPGNEDTLTDGRSIEAIPQDVREAYPIMFEHRSDPGPEPADAAVPAAPAQPDKLPPLKGRTYAQVEAAVMRQLRQSKPGEVARQIVQDRLDYQRGRI